LRLRFLAVVMHTHLSCNMKLSAVSRFRYGTTRGRWNSTPSPHVGNLQHASSIRT
jgi:hypothetical protein